MRQRVTALILTASLLLTGCNGNEAGGNNSGEEQETTSSSTQGNAPHTSEEKAGQAEGSGEQTKEESSSKKTVSNVVTMYFDGEMPVDFDVKLSDDIKYTYNNPKGCGFELIFSDKTGFSEYDSMSVQILYSSDIMPDETSKTITKEEYKESDGADNKISFSFRSRPGYSGFDIYPCITLVKNNIPYHYQYRISIKIEIADECITMEIHCYEIKNVPSDTEINYEFTDEDRELQGILDGLDNAWEIFITLKNFPICEEENAAIVIPQLEDGLEHTYSLLSDKELPFSTIDEMKAEMSKYFTEEAIESYCKLVGAARGEIVLEDEGVYTVNLADGLVFEDNGGSYHTPQTIELNGGFYYTPQLIELNGRMYRMQAYASYLSSIDTSLVKVLSRSEDEIIFAFIYGMYDKKYTGKGIVKYENGGWKYGWIADFSNEYSCDGKTMNFYEVWGNN